MCHWWELVITADTKSDKDRFANYCFKKSPEDLSNKKTAGSAGGFRKKVITELFSQFSLQVIVNGC